MAQINITLNQEEFLALINKSNDEFMRALLEKGLKVVLKEQSDAQIKAKRYDRTEEQTDYRNGSRDRELTT